MKRDGWIKENVMMMGMKVDLEGMRNCYKICGFKIKGKIMFKKLLGKFLVLLRMFFGMWDRSFLR